MAAFTNDLVDFVPKLDGQVGVLLVQLIFLLRHILGLDLLKLEAIKFQNLAEVFWLDDTIWKLPMEHPSSLGKAQMGLSLHVLRIEKVIKLPLIHGGKSDPLRSMQPARVELRWLNALPLDQELLLGLVMANQPFGPLIRHAKQFSDDS